MAHFRFQSFMVTWLVPVATELLLTRVSISSGSSPSKGHCFHPVTSASLVSMMSVCPSTLSVSHRILNLGQSCDWRLPLFSFGFGYSVSMCLLKYRASSCVQIRSTFAAPSQSTPDGKSTMKR